LSLLETPIIARKELPRKLEEGLDLSKAGEPGDFLMLELA
jgi:hypothetical protein